MTESICNTCNINKNLTEFYKDPTTKTGYSYKCKKCIKKYRNSKRYKEYQKEYQQSEKYKEYKRFYRKSDKNKECNKKYNLKNKTELNLKRKKRRKKLINRNIVLLENFRTQFRFYLHKAVADNNYLANKTKVGSVKDYLGCSIQEVKKYIETLWLPGMSWDNWGNGEGKWNIDHIKPLSKFDSTNPEDLKIVWHYTNLQPLWAEDNVKKGNKYYP